MSMFHLTPSQAHLQNVFRQRSTFGILAIAFELGHRAASDYNGVVLVELRVVLHPSKGGFGRPDIAQLFVEML
jgi:hypothetical protein